VAGRVFSDRTFPWSRLARRAVSPPGQHQHARVFPGGGSGRAKFPGVHPMFAHLTINRPAPWRDSRRAAGPMARPRRAPGARPGQTPAFLRIIDTVSNPAARRASAEPSTGPGPGRPLPALYPRFADVLPLTTRPVLSAPGFPAAAKRWPRIRNKSHKRGPAIGAGQFGTRLQHAVCIW
jgi:hypothetical protein